MFNFPAQYIKMVEIGTIPKIWVVCLSYILSLGSSHDSTTASTSCCLIVFCISSVIHLILAFPPILKQPIFSAERSIILVKSGNYSQNIKQSSNGAWPNVGHFYFTCKIEIYMYTIHMSICLHTHPYKTTYTCACIHMYMVLR